jgi:MinD-like ATPase involved in chromosome partitioning or flagellar assembly
MSNHDTALAPDIPPTPSRRELDPAQRATLLLASEFSDHRLPILRSEAVLQVVQHAIVRDGLLPEEILRLVRTQGPLRVADPITDLTERCEHLLVAEEGSPETAESPREIETLPESNPASAAHTLHPVPTQTYPTPPITEVTVQPEPGYQPTTLAKHRKLTAQRGWRQALHRLTFGLVKLGPGADEWAEISLIRATQTPIAGYRHVVVMSLKGGSGKTTTAVMLGHTFAQHRGDRIAALDASPDAGTLSYRIAEEPRTSIRTLLESAESLHRYVDVSALSGHASSRLDVIASDMQPTISRAFDSNDYRRAAEIVTRFYSLVLTDCGAGLMHDAMNAALDTADQIVLVLTPSVDGGRSAELTLNWLDSHGFSDLVRGAVVVINLVQGSKPLVDLEELRHHFASRVREVVDIPYDRHLAEGGPTDLAQLEPRTRRHYLKLAAAVARGFNETHRQEG